MCDCRRRLESTTRPLPPSAMVRAVAPSPLGAPTPPPSLVIFRAPCFSCTAITPGDCLLGHPGQGGLVRSLKGSAAGSSKLTSEFMRSYREVRRMELEEGATRILLRASTHNRRPEGEWRIVDTEDWCVRGMTTTSRFG